MHRLRDAGAHSGSSLRGAAVGEDGDCFREYEQFRQRNRVWRPPVPVFDRQEPTKRAASLPPTIDAPSARCGQLTAFLTFSLASP